MSLREQVATPLGTSPMLLTICPLESTLSTADVGFHTPIRSCCITEAFHVRI
jgi:hypothetical protein